MKNKTQKADLLKAISKGEIDVKEAFRQKVLTIRIGYPKDQASRLIDGKAVSLDEFAAEEARQGATGPMSVRYGNTGMLEGYSGGGNDVGYEDEDDLYYDI